MSTDLSKKLESGKSLSELLHVAFSRRRFGCQNEEQLQFQVQEVLLESDLGFQRECSLTESDRVDFFITDYAAAVEVKISGGIYNILAQMRRYAESPFVKELVLVCLRPISVPKTLAGKPLSCVPVYTCLL